MHFANRQKVHYKVHFIHVIDKKNTRNFLSFRQR